MLIVGCGLAIAINIYSGDIRSICPNVLNRKGGDLDEFVRTLLGRSPRDGRTLAVRTFLPIIITVFSEWRAQVRALDSETFGF